MFKLKPYWVKSPKWIKWLFPSYVWHISTPKKELFLTFDDGPDPAVTPFVLDQLKRYNAKATFFCIGECAKRQPMLLKRIKEEGHQIGNHTQHHLNGWSTNLKKYQLDILEAEKWLYNSEPKKTKLFRPPYGKSTLSQRKFLKQQGYTSIMWSILSADFDTELTKEEVLNNVISNTTNKGSILIFHDSSKMRKNVIYCLPKVLKHFSEKGYQFKRIDASTL